MDFLAKQVSEYVTLEGRSPFGEWLDSVSDQRLQVLVFTRLDRLRVGLLGFTNSVGNGVHELKIDYGPGYRLYFGNDGLSVVILLVGGSKKTHAKDIVNAKRYWRDYNSRKQDKSYE